MAFPYAHEGFFLFFHKGSIIPHKARVINIYHSNDNISIFGFVNEDPSIGLRALKAYFTYRGEQLFPSS